MSLNILNKETFGELNPEQKDFINMIIESANYTKDLLYSVLTAFRYDNTVLKINKIVFELKDLMSNCENEVRASLLFKNLKIKSTIRANTMYADLIQLRRVISNLLNNAIHYAFENSEIIIDVFEENDFVVFEFENLSEPIPEELKSKIFQKYVSTMGTGLGLYYCKKVIEGHKGTISLENNGVHNKFILKIPKENKEENVVNFND